MKTFEVIIAYPFYYDLSDENNRWVDFDRSLQIDAENEDAANFTIQKRIDNWELDATLKLPQDFGGETIAIRPYIPTEDTRKIDEQEQERLRGLFKDTSTE